ncbi:hypothetical protein Hanom_Chr03g00219631 [Helianthus anomalus]
MVCGPKAQAGYYTLETSWSRVGSFVLGRVLGSHITRTYIHTNAHMTKHISHKRFTFIIKFNQLTSHITYKHVTSRHKKGSKFRVVTLMVNQLS